jgi:hypothetical protein
MANFSCFNDSELWMGLTPEKHGGMELFERVKYLGK